MQRISPPNPVGTRASAPRRTSDSRCMRYWITSATPRMVRPCSPANFSRSGMRAMVPSSFITSQMTPAGTSPARRQRSTLPSVCPARTRTPPLRARSGKMWPGRTTSSGFASSAIAARMVVARSCALIPVVTPLAASMLTVKAVVYVLWFSLTIMVRPSCRTCCSVSERQIRPRACLAMKLMLSGVTCWAARTRSPSFSRSASSTRMTMRPRRSSSSAFSTRSMCSSTSSAPSGPELQQARHVFAEDVGLDVDAPAHGFDAPGRRAQRLRDQEQGDAVRVEQLVDGQRDPVQRDRPLRDHQRGEGPGDAQLEADALAHRCARRDLADAIDVAEHEVPAKPIAERHRPLEVHRVAFLPLSKRRSGDRFRAHVRRETAFGGSDGRQTYAVDGDAGALRQPRKPGLDRQPHTMWHPFDPGDGADVLDEAGEHLRRVYTRDLDAACLNLCPAAPFKQP